MNVPTLRTSERHSLGTCPQQWYWSWREGLVPKGRTGPNHFWFGIGVHEALAAWYCGPGTKRGPHPVETWQRYVNGDIEYIKTKDATEEDVAQYTDALTLGATMLQGYIDLYGEDSHMDVIQPEQTFAMDIPWPDRQDVYEAEKGALLTRYVGTYDLVYRDLRTGWVVLGEHKTAKAISLDHLPMDNQGGSYWAMASQTLRSKGLIGPKERLRGIGYNFLRKGLPDERPTDAQGYATNKPEKADYIAALNEVGEQRGKQISPKTSLTELQEIARHFGITVLGKRSKVQPAPLFVRHMVHRTSAERATQLRRIQDEAVLAQLYRDGRIPITLNPSIWNCRGCPHKAMCELKERGGNWQDFKALQYDVRDPYAEHRKSAAEE
jgi:PD-(D/E)XK nuclease superfamily